MEEQAAGTVARLAEWLRRVRFAVLAVIGVAYMVLPAWLRAPWLRPVLSVGALAVFLAFPALEAFTRNFREGYREDA